MEIIRKLTLLSVILCCTAWVAAQSSPSGGSTAPAGGSGTAGTKLSSGQHHCSSGNGNPAGRCNSNYSGFHIPDITEWGSEHNRLRVYFAKRDAWRDHPQYIQPWVDLARWNARCHDSRFDIPDRRAGYDDTGIDFP